MNRKERRLREKQELKQKTASELLLLCIGELFLHELGKTQKCGSLSKIIKEEIALAKSA